MNIGRLLNRHAKFRRNHPALIFGDERLTIRSLNSRVNQLQQEDTASPQELLEWVNERVAARFQKVKEVVIIDELPRTATGKVLKRSLPDM